MMFEFRQIKQLRKAKVLLLSVGLAAATTALGDSPCPVEVEQVVELTDKGRQFAFWMKACQEIEGEAPTNTELTSKTTIRITASSSMRQTEMSGLRMTIPVMGSRRCKFERIERVRSYYRAGNAVTAMQSETGRNTAVSRFTLTRPFFSGGKFPSVGVQDGGAVFEPAAIPNYQSLRPGSIGFEAAGERVALGVGCQNYRLAGQATQVCVVQFPPNCSAAAGMLALISGVPDSTNPDQMGAEQFVARTTSLRLGTRGAVFGANGFDPPAWSQ